MISIRIQKYIVLIPFLNCLILFIWVYNYGKMKRDFKVFAKSLLIISAIGLPLSVIQTIVKNLFGTAYILDILMIYAILLLIGLGLIRYQQKVLYD